MRLADNNSSSYPSSKPVRESQRIAIGAVPTQTTTRIASVDAYRGFVMVLILGEVFNSCVVSASLPTSRLWSAICGQQTHSAWVGMSLHDVIQPSFYFLVGVALLLSASRKQSPIASQRLVVHTVVRSVLLVVLGMALVAIHPRRWDWYFVDTLTQIGLAYPFLVIIARRPRKIWYLSLTIVLSGYWLWFALWPLPGPQFDYASVGVPIDWMDAHGLSGFARHWQKNSNAAADFDRWFLNLFPRDTPHVGYDSGLTTLNFIPSLGTMILGVIAGDRLRSTRTLLQKVRWFGYAGTALICIALLLHVLGICPIVKAIWTPSWVLFSGGSCMLLLALFLFVVDCLGFQRASWPFRVVGMNSLVAYSMYHVYPALAFNSFRRLFGTTAFRVLGTAYEPILYGAVVFSAYWFALWLLYRQRIFVRA